MAVPVGDHVAIRKPGAESRVTVRTLAGVVDEPGAHPLGLDDEARGQLRPQGRLVDVAVDSVHRSERTQLGEDGRGDEVADVQDEIRLRKQADGGRREPARPARKVRVSDERDQETPSRKRPSR